MQFSERAGIAAIVATALAVLAGCATEQAGNTNVPTPDVAPILDTSEERGACIGATAKYETCAYAIAVIGPEDQPRMILSRKEAGMSEDGQAQWQELDRLDAPAVPRGGSLVFGICRDRGAQDDTILALLPVHDDTAPEFIAAANWAYRVELPSGRFVALDARGVDCTNTAIGAD